MLTFVSDAGVPTSTARASRLPDPVVLLHPTLALAAVGLWITWMATDERGVAWAGVATLLLGAAIGAFMGLRTLQPAPEPYDVSPDDPAAGRLAEKRIPLIAILGHGGLALLIILLALLAALGV